MFRKRGESKSDKKSPKEQFNEVLTKNPDAVQKIIHQYIDMLQIHYDEGDPVKRKAKVMDAIKPIFEQMFGSDITIQNLGGENNLNLLIKYKGDEFVVQIGAFREPSLTAVDQLSSDRTNKWIAQRYGMHVFSNDSSITKSVTLEDMSLDSSTKPVGLLLVVEKLESSLKSEMQKIQSDKPRVMFDSTKEIEFAKTVGLQLRDLFLSLHDNNMIWTDCKPGNLLARPNSDGSFQLVVADSKAILPSDQLPIGLESGRINFSGLMTEAYFSSQGFDRLATMNNPKPSDVMKVMEKEYSYQMAVMLYYSATGREVLSKGSSQDTTFDFSHPMFQTEQGQRLKTVIEELSKPNPDERMDYNTAARLISVIDKKQAFDMVMEKFHRVSVSTADTSAPVPDQPSPSTSRIMMGLVTPNPTERVSGVSRQRAQSEAAAMLKRRTSVSRIEKPVIKSPETEMLSQTVSQSVSSERQQSSPMEEKKGTTITGPGRRG